VSGSSLIGVAIAIPEPWGAELERWRASFGDPQASAIPAHVTLLPPTRVPDDEIGDVQTHLADAAADVAPFPVLLRGTGTFRPVSPVVFVSLASGIAGCEALEQRVRSGPLARELEFPYHPHVTVAHDLPDPVLDGAFDALAAFEASFTVEHFVIYVHVDGAWTPRSSFDLRG
jgi:2'-5' RNA ligase